MGYGRDDTQIPPTIRANAVKWYRCGSSPKKAADSTVANSGVRLAKKPATAGTSFVCPDPRRTAVSSFFSTLCSQLNLDF